MTSRLPRENQSRRFGEKLGKMRDLGKGNILVLLDLGKGHVRDFSSRFLSKLFKLLSIVAK